MLASYQLCMRCEAQNKKKASSYDVIFPRFFFSQKALVALNLLPVIAVIVDNVFFPQFKTQDKKSL